MHRNAQGTVSSSLFHCLALQNNSKSSVTMIRCLCKALKGGILGIVTSRFFRWLMNSFKNCYTPAHLSHSKTSKGNIQGVFFLFFFLYLALQFWKNQEQECVAVITSHEQGYFHVRMRGMKAAYGKHSPQLCLQFPTHNLLKNERPIFSMMID